MKGKISLAMLALSLTVGWGLAQGPSGYIKIGTVLSSATTYTDATCGDGTACNYTVTAVNVAGESGPSNITVAVIPSTGTHSVVLKWTAPGGLVDSYNIYQSIVQKPGPPTGCTATVQ